jgi:quercetin dioxygenase-like cupin family protein
MTVTLAVCPPGTGPGLHTHHQTCETFTVLPGSFCFTWGHTATSRPC